MTVEGVREVNNRIRTRAKPERERPDHEVEQDEDEAEQGVREAKRWRDAFDLDNDRNESVTTTTMMTSLARETGQAELDRLRLEATERDRIKAEEREERERQKGIVGMTEEERERERSERRERRERAKPASVRYRF